MDNNSLNLRIISFIVLLAAAFGQELEVHFIDVGQGDSVLIQVPSGETVIYDGGVHTHDAFEYLNKIGVTDITLVIASHMHADHIGGLIQIVEELEPRFFMGNSFPHDTRVYEDLERAVTAFGIHNVKPNNQVINLGAVDLQVLPVPGFESWGQNNNSVGIIISYGDFQVSLTGDAEQEQFDWWLHNHPDLLVDVEVHKASHHGSSNGDTTAGLIKLMPETVVIGVGKGNSYGHPKQASLRLYDSVGAEVFRTDLHGHIVVKAKLDGSYTVTTEKTFFLNSSPMTNSIDLRVECVLYNPAGQDAGNEVITLRSKARLNTALWYIEDEAGHRVYLPNSTLTENQELKVIFPKQAVWNNSGDTVFLFDDSGQQIDHFTYSGGNTQECR